MDEKLKSIKEELELKMKKEIEEIRADMFTDRVVRDQIKGKLDKMSAKMDDLHKFLIGNPELKDEGEMSIIKHELITLKQSIQLKLDTSIFSKFAKELRPKIKWITDRMYLEKILLAVGTFVGAGNIYGFIKIMALIDKLSR